MKKYIKLVLFFSICFTLVFIVAILLRFLGIWIELVRFIPVEARPGGDVTEAAWKALPVALYLSILLSLCNTVRLKIPIPFAISCVIILSCVFTAGASLGITRARTMRVALRSASPLQGEPGLILSRSDNSMILLKESSEIMGPRVVSIPGRPLIYQQTPVGPHNTVLNLPALPFSNDTPWFIRSLDIDINLSAGQLESRLEQNFFSFAVYAFSLILLLGSMRFILELSQWLLANLFMGALVFRGVLILETFINAREINGLLDSFLAGRVPPGLISPLVFTALGVLIILYTLLVRIARPRRGIDD